MIAAILETLKDTREQIATEDRWCKGHLALDKDGLEVSPRAEGACYWCIVGAIDTVRKDLATGKQAVKFLDNYHGGCIVNLNDHPDTTHQDMIRFLDRAIKEVEQNVNAGQ